MEHEARLEAWLGAVRGSEWFQRAGGRDHLFPVGDINMGWGCQHHLPEVRDLLGNGFSGTFEMNGAWLGNWPMVSKTIASISEVNLGFASHGPSFIVHACQKCIDLN